MRKALLVVCVLFAVPSFAQESNVQLSVFGSDVGYGWTENNGGDWSGGIGAALEYRWNKQWALELQVSSEEHTTATVLVDQNGTAFVQRRQERVHPIDLLAHYHFDNTSRWKPFVGVGLRYQRALFSPSDNVTLLEIDGGVHLMITPSLSLRLDAKQQLFDDEGHFDAGLKPSIGFGWRF